MENTSFAADWSPEIQRRKTEFWPRTSDDFQIVEGRADENLTQAPRELRDQRQRLEHLMDKWF